MVRIHFKKTLRNCVSVIKNSLKKKTKERKKRKVVLGIVTSLYHLRICDTSKETSHIDNFGIIPTLQAIRKTGLARSNRTKYNNFFMELMSRTILSFDNV